MKAPKQANTEVQKELIDIMNDVPMEITLTSGKKIKIGWLRPDTQDKINELLVNYELAKKKVDSNDQKSVLKGNKITRKLYSKILAAVLINNYFGLKLFWWLKWRIIYHFWYLNGNDYITIAIESKKKATEQQYSVAMAFLTTMSDMWTMMTKKEAEAYRQELDLAKKQQQ